MRSDKARTILLGIIHLVHHYVLPQTRSVPRIVYETATCLNRTCCIVPFTSTHVRIWLSIEDFVVEEEYTRDSMYSVLKGLVMNGNRTPASTLRGSQDTTCYHILDPLCVSILTFRIRPVVKVLYATSVVLPLWAMSLSWDCRRRKSRIFQLPKSHCAAD